MNPDVPMYGLLPPALARMNDHMDLITRDVYSYRVHSIRGGRMRREDGDVRKT